ncbi:ABC transporter permease [Sphaerobacter thermophilus]|uniref:Binding-protein-dependent transport systems inner membrane component n=1 Tax=Sphaerobacter thermophilus (strain ATCC 49802 / DSM 20745 / KCCM 41009 / NCIMB 13125 / S 6022) TaxID=479434 RepID=D1C531_SPHTD|nr:ABC transporter permease [Sphaerobacter thermophilus]ACZ39348.1 binding-protein-dependent transport systems inner membrane component [Sphaerobacter thermophilus DSM 20745]
MLAYAIRRVFLAVPVMLIVASAVFLLMHFAPGDPVGVMLGPDASEEQRLALREKLGLDDPIVVQYVRWLSHVLRGDLGQSLFLDQPVTTALAERAQPTIMLGILSLIVAIVIGLTSGILAARSRGSWLDLSLMGGAMIGITVPSFVLGLLLIFFFAIQLRWLPVAGYQPLSAGLWESLRYLILPAITLGAGQSAFLGRMTRSMMLDVLGQDYVRTARAKGLAEQTVILRHTLRNAFVPLLTIIGLMTATLMSGAVITEQIFDIPGMGRLLIQAVVRRDFPLVQGAVLVIAAVYVLINLLVDLLVGFVDPRIER